MCIVSYRADVEQGPETCTMCKCTFSKCSHLWNDGQLDSSLSTKSATTWHTRDPIEFQSSEHTREVLNQTLSNTDDFVEVLKTQQSSKAGTSIRPIRGYGIPKSSKDGVEAVRRDHRARQSNWKNIELILSNERMIGETLVMRMSTQTSSIQPQKTILVQFLSLERCQGRSPSSISNGSSQWFRMKECIVLTAT